ncbi:MAG: rhomboid family intramembrane serine protease [Iamia sp.]
MGPPSRSDSSQADTPTSDLLRPFVIVGLLVAVMGVEEVIDLIPGTPFDSWGIEPRSLDGLVGVPLAPFLHSGFRHLLANTLPFLILGGIIASGGIGRFVRVSVIVGLVSGLGTWLFASPGTVHLGASGLVFGYLTYLIGRGIFARNVLWLAGGALILLVYGGILWGLLPRPGVSWTGHAFGAVGGVLAAWVLHRRGDEPAPDDPLG